MRAILAIVSLALEVISMAAASGAAEFPYVAYVIEPQTYVRSGPGNQHYATGQVPAGYAVEVYRHDGEGWCAIRPPEGSFSLAPAHQLRVLDSRTAEVTASGVVARVGSSLGEQRNAVQVLLERGEIVQLVEQPTPGQPWVKIAPPAGEFRWIASRRLSRTPPVEGGGLSSGNWVARPESASGAPSTQRSTLLTNTKDAHVDESKPGGANSFAHLESSPPGQMAAAPLPANPAWLPSASSDGSAIGAATAMAAATPNDLEIVAGSPADVRLAQHEEPAQPREEAAGKGSTGAGESVAKSGSPRIRLNSASADPRVAEMQIRLSQIVVQPPVSWQLGGLREETAALLAQEQTPAVRDQLRDLLDRIATFETVQSRYRGPAAVPGMPNAASVASAPAPGVQNASPGLTGQSSEVLARVRSDLGVDNTITPTPGGQPAAAAPSPAATQALYDAVGTLKPVVSRRDKAPRYALVDDHGDVVTFVTAAADVNLQPYVGKRIGVRGSRGFMPEYRRAHVTASRVTPLEETLVR
jgi:hypothetical protein